MVYSVTVGLMVGGVGVFFSFACGGVVFAGSCFLIVLLKVRCMAMKWVIVCVYII